jgi:4-aminobutyrate aminotransferase/(S)-3-amino-2-methylpropionate transaminase
MSRSENLVRRRDAVVCPGVSRGSGLTAASAKGAIITDLDGREFIDFAGGIGVMNVGHSDPAVVKAIAEQASKLQHTCIHVATYEPYVALCEELASIFPHGRAGEATKVVLINTGAEAVENSIKIARQATGRDGVICFTGAFHGRTMLCSTLTSKVDYKKGCGPFLSEIYRLPYPRRFPGEPAMSEAALVERELSRLRAAFKDTVAAENVAAIIIEPVQGEGGFHVAPAEYLRGLRAICDEHGIVLIFDEVQSGFCRTGKWAAYEHAGVVPDLSTWAKSMGGGMVISCVIGSAKVMDKVTPGTLGGTYGGNPVSCAAALAAISSMKKLDLNARGAAMGKIIRDRFHALHGRTSMVTEVRGLGAMVAIELCEDGDERRPAAAVVKKVVDSCRERGLLVISAGVYGNVIRVLAPLVIMDEELQRGLDILCEEISRHAGSTPRPLASASA